MQPTVKNAICAALVTAAPAAYAAGGAESEGSSFLLALFLGFGALVVVFQLFPGGVLFFSMIKGLFSASKNETSATDKADHLS